MEVKVLRPEGVDFPPGRLAEELSLARDLLRKYRVRIEDLGLIQANAKAVVWRVETRDGPRALKLIGRKSDKALFSILAHHHMETRGFPVPRIARTADGELYVSLGPRVAFLAEWIEGRPVLRDDDAEWNLFLKTLAQFHQRSKGMRPPPGIRVKTKLGGWPLEYRKKIGQMRAWLAEAANKQGPYFALYRELAPPVIERAEILRERLHRSHYWEWVEVLARERGLCHSDYGESNTLLTPKGQLYVIDMDTVTFDLPVRDLRKVFESYLDPGIDLSRALSRVLDTYRRYQPLGKHELNVFLVDVQFPYKFYQAAKMGFLQNDLDEEGLIQEARLDLRRSDAAAAYSKRETGARTVPRLGS